MIITVCEHREEGASKNEGRGGWVGWGCYLVGGHNGDQEGKEVCGWWGLGGGEMRGVTLWVRTVRRGSLESRGAQQAWGEAVRSAMWKLRYTCCPCKSISA